MIVLEENRLQFLVFWSINDSLNANRLIRQLDELQQSGIEGVVFHPRYYPDQPAYMSQVYLDILSEVILHARSIGMEFWIYDENGWPSGTAGGQVIARHPQLTCEWLEYKTDTSRHHVEVHARSAVSSLDREATDTFIAITHEGYRTGLQPEAFEYVTGFFTDEVGFLDGHSVSVEKGAVPWHRELPERYMQRYGEALEPLLPLLFIDKENTESEALTSEGAGYGVDRSVATKRTSPERQDIPSRLYSYTYGAAPGSKEQNGLSEKVQQLRIRYWELLTDALVEGYYRPIAEWCDRHGKLFTGHLKGEENPFFQLVHSGSCFSVLQGLTLPGIDALERYPGNDFYPRMVHSIAVQQGRSGCLAEAHGGSGWGVTPETFSRYILWLAGHGVRQFVLHLSQYELSSQAVHDWPPSMPLHLSWHKVFPQVLQSIREQTRYLPDLRSKEPELLIVTPTRGVMASFHPADAMVINVHDGAGVPDTPAGRISNTFMQLVEYCHQAGIHYEFTEERVLEETGMLENGSVRIGERRYSRVMPAEGCVWQSSGNGDEPTMIERMIAAGVELINPAHLPADLDQRNSSHTAHASIPIAADGADKKRADNVRLDARVPEQSLWSMSLPASNNYTIYWEDKGEGWWSIDIPIDHDSITDQPADIQLVLLDQPLAVRINDQDINVELTEGSPLSQPPFRYSIPAQLVEKQNHLHITIQTKVAAEPDPVAFLEGNFLVYSDSPYRDKDKRQCYTSGPLRLVGMPNPQSGQALMLNPQSIVQSGYPFYTEPVEMTTTVSIDADRLDIATEELYVQLTDVDADTACIRINGELAGWCWAPDWQVPLPMQAIRQSQKEDRNPAEKPGTYANDPKQLRLQIAVELIPSTYNRYGPHLHIDGDRHLVSPDQYKGIRNFADDPDAPVCTRGENYHFVNCGIRGEIRLLTKVPSEVEIKLA
ncbi:hypothetical protein [Paenibacillus bovis]|uniref:Glycoside hydrolase n=1 Tax=Paenibacillus bovis TaxID=1616788 RepID=A0A172ZII9_9BACL|nr:hypothetical protein [Paenibacillus bovis]ANF96950.1 hypothetical protein AR543_13670 [Paenibacillus bovis]